MSLISFDAEFCPDPVPAGFDFAEAYIGGSSAAHVWDEDELTLVRDMLVLPIWVPSPGFDNPVQTAVSAAHELKILGVPDHATPFRALMLDMETSADAAFVNSFSDRLASLGYDTYVYGSAGNLFSLPNRAGYVVADPTGLAHMYQRPGVSIVGTQYAWDVSVPGGTIDRDLWAGAVADHLGRLAV